MTKTTCILCDKPIDDGEEISFGDEYSHESCHQELFAEVERDGQEKEIDIPEGVNINDLCEYIHDNYEWFTEQVGADVFAYKIHELENQPRKVKIKYI